MANGTDKKSSPNTDKFTHLEGVMNGLNEPDASKKVDDIISDIENNLLNSENNVQTNGSSLEEGKTAEIQDPNSKELDNMDNILEALNSPQKSKRPRKAPITSIDSEVPIDTTEDFEKAISEIDNSSASKSEIKQGEVDNALSDLDDLMSELANKQTAEFSMGKIPEPPTAPELLTTGSAGLTNENTEEEKKKAVRNFLAEMDEEFNIPPSPAAEMQTPDQKASEIKASGTNEIEIPSAEQTQEIQNKNDPFLDPENDGLKEIDDVLNSVPTAESTKTKEKSPTRTEKVRNFASKAASIFRPGSKQSKALDEITETLTSAKGGKKAVNDAMRNDLSTSMDTRHRDEEVATDQSASLDTTKEALRKAASTDESLTEPELNSKEAGTSKLNFAQKASNAFQGITQMGRKEVSQEDPDNYDAELAELFASDVGDVGDSTTPVMDEINIGALSAKKPKDASPEEAQESTQDKDIIPKTQGINDTSTPLSQEDNTDIKKSKAAKILGITEDELKGAKKNAQQENFETIPLDDDISPENKDTGDVKKGRMERLSDSVSELGSQARQAFKNQFSPANNSARGGFSYLNQKQKDIRAGIWKSLPSLTRKSEDKNQEIESAIRDNSDLSKYEIKDLRRFKKTQKAKIDWLRTEEELLGSDGKSLSERSQKILKDSVEFVETIDSFFENEKANRAKDSALNPSLRDRASASAKKVTDTIAARASGVGATISDAANSAQKRTAAVFKRKGKDEDVSLSEAKVEDLKTVVPGTETDKKVVSDPTQLAPRPKTLPTMRGIIKAINENKDLSGFDRETLVKFKEAYESEPDANTKALAYVTAIDNHFKSEAQAIDSSAIPGQENNNNIKKSKAAQLLGIEDSLLATELKSLEEQKSKLEQTDTQAADLSISTPIQGSTGSKTDGIIDAINNGDDLSSYDSKFLDQFRDSNNTLIGIYGNKSKLSKTEKGILADAQKNVTAIDNFFDSRSQAIDASATLDQVDGLQASDSPDTKKMTPKELYAVDEIPEFGKGKITNPKTLKDTYAVSEIPKFVKKSPSPQVSKVGDKAASSASEKEVEPLGANGHVEKREASSLNPHAVKTPAALAKPANLGRRFVNDAKQTLYGIPNLGKYAKHYFTEKLPGYLKNEQNKYTSESIVAGTWKITKDVAGMAAKTGLVIGGFIPGASQFAGAIALGRIGYNTFSKKDENGKEVGSGVGRAFGAIAGGVAGFFAGSVPGVAGVISAAYDAKKLCERSGAHYYETHPEKAPEGFKSKNHDAKGKEKELDKEVTQGAKKEVGKDNKGAEAGKDADKEASKSSEGKTNPYAQKTPVAIRLAKQWGRGVQNVGNYAKKYFTETLPGNFKNEENKYTFGSVVAGSLKTAWTVSKVGLVVAGSIPGISGAVAGVVIGARIGYNTFSKKDEAGKEVGTRIGRAFGVIAGAVAGGFAGSVGAAGAISAAYDINKIVMKSGEQYYEANPDKAPAGFKPKNHNAKVQEKETEVMQETGKGMEDKGTKKPEHDKSQKANTKNDVSRKDLSQLSAPSTPTPGTQPTLTRTQSSRW